MEVDGYEWLQSDSEHIFDGVVVNNSLCRCLRRRPIAMSQWVIASKFQIYTSNSAPLVKAFLFGVVPKMEKSALIVLHLKVIHFIMSHWQESKADALCNRVLLAEVYWHTLMQSWLTSISGVIVISVRFNELTVCQVWLSIHGDAVASQLITLGCPANV